LNSPNYIVGTGVTTRKQQEALKKANAEAERTRLEQAKLERANKLLQETEAEILRNRADKEAKRLSDIEALVEKNRKKLTKNKFRSQIFDYAKANPRTKKMTADDLEREIEAEAEAERISDIEALVERNRKKLAKNKLKSQIPDYIRTNTRAKKMTADDLEREIEAEAEAERLLDIEALVEKNRKKLIKNKFRSQISDYMKANPKAKKLTANQLRLRELRLKAEEEEATTRREREAVESMLGEEERRKRKKERDESREQTLPFKVTRAERDGKVKRMSKSIAKINEFKGLIKAKNTGRKAVKAAQEAQEAAQKAQEAANIEREKRMSSQEDIDSRKYEEYVARVKFEKLRADAQAKEKAARKRK
jgi:hypothetical protein